MGVLWSLLIAWSVSCFVLCHRVLSGREDNPGALEGVRIDATLGLLVLSPAYVLATRAADPTAPLLAVAATKRDYFWLAVISLSTNLGLGLQTFGFQTATSLSAVALVTYVEVPCGYVFQYFICKEPPKTFQCVGSAIIVGACVAHTLLDARQATKTPG